MFISEKRLNAFFLFNRYIPILNQIAKSIEDILRYHEISFDTLNTMVTRKYRFSNSFILSVLHDQTSVESL